MGHSSILNNILNDYFKQMFKNGVHGISLHSSGRPAHLLLTDVPALQLRASPPLRDLSRGNGRPYVSIRHIHSSGPKLKKRIQHMLKMTSKT